MVSKVIVNGARGKMGTLACDTLRQHPEFELVGTLGREDNLMRTITETSADIVVDLTRADAVYANTLTVIEAGVHPVIGTSGLTDEQISHLQTLCTQKELGGIIVPNFSLGAVLMMHLAAIAARYLPEVEIIEAHHQQKLDAPSGTALKTADAIAKARTQQKNHLDLKESVTGARGAYYQNINIHAIRLPGMLAQQQVLFGNTGETLSITHNSLDRSCFMPGLILACQHVRHLPTLEYGMERLLFEK